MMSVIAAGEEKGEGGWARHGVVNGLLDAMFNLQQSEISIYHQHNDGEPGREKKRAGRERKGRGVNLLSFFFLFPPPVPLYLMN